MEACMTDMDTSSSERKPVRRTKAKTTASAEEGAARRKGAKSPRSKESPAPAAAHEGDSGAHPSRAEPEPGAARYTDAQWHAKVAELAYLRAERRGFVNGSPDQDWLEAEEELRCELQASAGAGSDPRAG
jgi:hypothetical protein